MIRLPRPTERFRFSVRSFGLGKEDLRLLIMALPLFSCAPKGHDIPEGGQRPLHVIPPFVPSTLKGYHIVKGIVMSMSPFQGLKMFLLFLEIGTLSRSQISHPFGVGHEHKQLLGHRVASFFVRPEGA